ncbi:hypothetical protein F0562_035813 [Nyssa sinensis]|uniref:Uncharacterized protein n=1 Tax=Nyssa sinensis TaxID=561372 RepID=A0A5J5AE47_9ASTE|nr:hypothetical protein F0562_035813 [Nyssa sinensis]
MYILTQLTHNLCSEDYHIALNSRNIDKGLQFSSEVHSGVVLVSTVLKKGRRSSGNVAAQYKYKNDIADVKVDTEANISTTLIVTDILPSTKIIASFELPNYNSGKIDVQYVHDHKSFSTAVDLNRCPAVDLSATIGTPSIAFGTEATYMVASGNFTKYNAGTVVKAKLNNHGNLGALIQHELKPKSFLAISGAFDTKAMEKRPRFGLAPSLKP